MDRFELGARMHRLRATAYRCIAAQEDARAAVVTMAGSFHQLAEVMSAGDARDVATHPDLAELNVQMDGYYDHG